VARETSSKRVSATRRVGLVVSLGLAVARGAAAGDFQLWPEVAVEAPIGRDFNASLQHESRFVEDVHRYGLHNYDLGVEWSANERLALSLHFLQEFERSGDRFLPESRPYADAVVHHPAGGLDLSSRTRVEARLLRHRPDLVRLRERVQVVFPWSLWPDGPRPYVSEEVFFETNGRWLDQNRATFGFTARRGALQAKLYGMIVSQKREHWENTTVLGLGLTWSFGGKPTPPGHR
jgi:hypothetical protein